MITFKQKLLAELGENGLHPHMAEDAFKLIEQDEAMSPMRGRWNDDIEGYPAPMVRLNWIGAKPIVAKYLAEKHPLAWFRPMFAEGVEKAEDIDGFIKGFWDQQPKPTLMSEQATSIEVSIPDIPIEKFMKESAVSNLEEAGRNDALQEIADQHLKNNG